MALSRYGDFKQCSAREAFDQSGKPLPFARPTGTVSNVNMMAYHWFPGERLGLTGRLPVLDNLGPYLILAVGPPGRPATAWVDIRLEGPAAFSPAWYLGTTAEDATAQALEAVRTRIKQGGL